MPQNFSGQNLRGRSFQGLDLTGADFSYTDIRSTNFTDANLTEANFCHAQAGLQRRWAILLVLVSWLLAGVSGFFSASAGALVSLILDSSSLANQIAGWTSLVVLIVFLRVIIRFGIEASVATVAGAFAVAVAGTGAIAVAVVVARTFAIAVAGVFAIAGTFASAGAFAVAVAVAFAIFNLEPL